MSSPCVTNVVTQTTFPFEHICFGFLLFLGCFCSGPQGNYPSVECCLYHCEESMLSHKVQIMDKAYTLSLYLSLSMKIWCYYKELVYIIAFIGRGGWGFIASSPWLASSQRLLIIVASTISEHVSSNSVVHKAILLLDEYCKDDCSWRLLCTLCILM